MKNIKNISYLDIEKLLIKNKLNPISNLKKSEVFYSLNSLIKANSTDLTFFSDQSKVNLLKKTKAKACLINEENIKYLPRSTKAIIVNDIYKSFAVLSNLFFPNIQSTGVVSKQSSIDSTCIISDNVQIDPFVTIGPNCFLNNNVIIESNCTIGPNVTIGLNSVVKSNTNLQDCIIGSNCIIKSGAVIGGTGFGFDPKTKVQIKHIGNVVIKDNCNIGSNTAIDRAVFESTIISENCYIDNLVQIAHNVIIGKEAIIASQTGIAGSTKIGEKVVIGGQVGISGHLNIGKNVKIAAKSGVTKNISDGSVVAGFPAIDIKRWKIANIKLNKL